MFPLILLESKQDKIFFFNFKNFEQNFCHFVKKNQFESCLKLFLFEASRHFLARLHLDCGLSLFSAVSEISLVCARIEFLDFSKFENSSLVKESHCTHSNSASLAAFLKTFKNT